MRANVVKAIVLLAVVAAAAAGGFVALVAFRIDRDTTVASARLSVTPSSQGALDLYVPLVDWGARFPVVRFPARLHVDVRSVDRTAVGLLARGREEAIAQVRDEVRDAIASYIRLLITVVFASSLALGSLTAFAVRGRAGPRLRFTVPAAILTSIAWVVVLLVLLPPRGRVDDPEYYAHGPEIPRALAAVEAAAESSGRISEELDSQLVGLARLLGAPAGRPPLSGLPQFVLASDLHNNVAALPALERATAGRPLFFDGDLTDSGSPFEAALVQRVVHAGRPFVFVSGNHDSDTLSRQLAAGGAIVLTQRGRLLPGGGYGPRIVTVGGLRVAGYSDPFERRRADHYRSRGEPSTTPAQRRAFTRWLLGVAEKVDVVMVHAPGLAEDGLEELRVNPPAHPLLVLEGHSHDQSLSTSTNLAVVNGGTVGAGGTGNLDEDKPIGLAVITYRTRNGVAPLAADLVEIDPGKGSASARRERLDLSP
ncbi:MAG TPA: metallophosphoesterase family protein [Thermoleophilaceae bacterium]|nr:metallophosphoesterase family protein [Thermoleophilaceae bacterium]